MGFLRRLLYKLSDFMQGRYGMDGLYIPILIVSCAFTLLGTLCNSLLLRLIGSLLLIWLVFRALSKNHSARRRELYAYYNIKNKVVAFFHKSAAKAAKQKNKRYLKCPKCKAKLSVPKGIGKIRITCTVCKHQFEKKV